MPNQLEERLLTHRIRGFRGTDNTRHSTELQDGFAADLQNAELTTIGKLTSRRGFSTVANDTGDATRIVGMSEFNPEGGTHKLIRVVGQKFEFWTGSGNWTSVSTPFTLTDDLITDIVVANNRAFMFNGTDNVYSYDGSTLTDEGNTSTDVPRGTHAIWAGNRLFVTGNASEPSIVWYSDSLAPQTFNRTGNRLSINVGENYPIRGIVKFREFEILVFKTRGIYLVDISDATPSNWTITPLDIRFGCIAKRSIAQVGLDIWFLGNDGHIRSVRRNEQNKLVGADVPVSEPIQEWIDDINMAAVSNAHAVYFDNMYILFVPIGGSSTINVAYVYDFITQGWVKWTNMSFLSTAISTVQATDEERLFAGSSGADSQIYRLLNGQSDDGTAISVTVETPRIDHGIPENTKNWETCEVEVIASGGTLTVEAQINGGGYSTIGTIDASGNLPQLPIDLPFDLKESGLASGKFPGINSLAPGRNIQYRLTYSESAEEMQLKGVFTVAHLNNLEFE